MRACFTLLCNAGSRELLLRDSLLKDLLITGLGDRISYCQTALFVLVNSFLDVLRVIDDVHTLNTALLSEIPVLKAHIMQALGFSLSLSDIPLDYPRITIKNNPIALSEFIGHVSSRDSGTASRKRVVVEEAVEEITAYISESVQKKSKGDLEWIESLLVPLLQRLQ